MRKRLYIETWGCQLNLHQSEGLAGVLERAGFVATDSLSEADVVLFNTCAVRKKAEEKAYGRIGAVAEEKRARPVIFGVGGCLAQLRGASLLKRFSTIDFLFGTSDLSALPGLIAAVEEGKGRPAHLPHPAGGEEVPYRRVSPVTAMVTITEGCSNACSYCVVPRARGPLRSRPPEAVLAEVEALVSAGYKEVLLLGQNVDSYGKERPEYGDFAGLLERVARTGISRVRFTSSHPQDLAQAVIDAIARHENVCKHLHLACQSGSDRILAAMNRGHTRADFLSIVRRAREAVERINLTTDLIVGYPGESEEDFRLTRDLVEEVRFGSLFVAKYSPRPGTPSARLPDDVPLETKDARLQELLALERAIALEENERRIGDTLEVLVEGRAKRGGLYGRADDHRTVVLTGAAEMGEFVPVLIEGASAAALAGRPLARDPLGVGARRSGSLARPL